MSKIYKKNNFIIVEKGGEKIYLNTSSTRMRYKNGEWFVFDGIIENTVGLGAYGDITDGNDDVFASDDAFEDYITVLAGGIGTQKESISATAGQTIFITTFGVSQVFVDGVLQESGYSGGGTNTITFTVGLSEGQQVTLLS